MSDAKQTHTTQNGHAQSQETPTKKAQDPIHTVRDGSLSASIWERKNSKTGEIFFDTTIAHNWRDDDGKWHSGNNFSEYQLGRLPDLSANTRAIIQGLRHERGLSSSRENYREQRRSQSNSDNRQHDSRKR